MSKKNVAPVGMAVLKAPKNSGGFTWQGQFYPVEDGMLLIPGIAVADAKCHGFTEDTAE